MADAAQVALAWKNRVAGSGDKYKQGVMATKVNPMERAAQQKNKYLAKTAEAVASGKYEQSLMRVGKADWQQACANKGAQRLVSGAADGQAKVQKFMQEFLPYVDSVKAQIDQMPSTTPEEMDQRMLANVRLMRQFKRSAR